jgi:prevent-host-death family protein
MRSEDIQPFTEYRAHLADHHRRVRETGRPLFVTKDGRTSAVVLSPEAYDRLAEFAQQADDLAAIRRSLADVSVGRVRSAKDALKDIAARVGVKLRA